MRDAHLGCVLAVDGVLTEVFCFSLNGIGDWHLVDNLLLRTALHAIVAQLEWVDFALKQL